MNSITAHMLSKSIQQDRLGEAERRRAAKRKPTVVERRTRRWRFTIPRLPRFKPAEG
jgi:hypothetical protein